MTRLAAALLCMSVAAAHAESPSRIYKLCLMEDPQCVPLILKFSADARRAVCSPEELVSGTEYGKEPVGAFLWWVDYMGLGVGNIPLRQAQGNFVRNFLGCR